MKIFIIFLVLASSVFGEETFFKVSVPYTEGSISFQGSYFLQPNKDGITSLKTFGIEREGQFTAVQIEAFIKKEFEAKLDITQLNNITVDEISYDKEKLIQKNEVLVSGQIKKPGSYSITKHKTLGEIITLAEPTPFGSIRRIMLFRDGKRYSYDIRKAEYADFKILAGDMIIVPQVRWNGN